MNPPESTSFDPHSAPSAFADRPPLGSPIDLLKGLNDPQRAAVQQPAGPMLVLAGAGSGKTRVITHRIAYLVRQHGVQPNRVVAVTFTNKAAGEMRDRVSRLLGEHLQGCWIGTFHGLCLRILRRDGMAIGLEPSFVIYDTDDQLSIVRRILKEEAAHDGAGTPRSFLSRISRAKNAMLSPSAYEKQAFSPDAKLTAAIYHRYDEALSQANAVDFDDLLVKVLELFKTEPTVAAGYADRCEHLLVDEYQDTNRPQYRLIRHLSQTHRNVCAVGDEDQSIYRFRGAELRNILDFERDFEETTTIRLEQNYRSTSTIINAAGAVIANNKARKGKTLWTENAGGEPIVLYRAPDDRVEATWVAQQIRGMIHERPYEDVAVLYRTNALSRQLEEVFRRDRIPYQIVGSVQFYARKEIKDLLAYLMLTANLADDVAFRRAVNTPTRGIGNTTVKSVENVARTLGLPLMAAARQAIEQGALPARSAGKLAGFLDLIEELKLKGEEQGVAGMIEYLVEAIDYERFLDKSFGAQAMDRMENVKALVSAAVEFAEESDTDTLQGFLDHSALVAGADEISDRPGVTMMTIHCAKGLEYPVVFLIGLEENLFPHAMSMGSDEDIEEERRLCYVAMTRAEQRLFVSHARFRRLQGTLLPNPSSRFLQEIPGPLLREDPASEQSGFFDDFGVRDRSDRAGSSALRAAKRAAVTPGRTIADNLSAPGAHDPAAAEDGFRVGRRVRHPRFGVGTITAREGSGKLLKLTIQFQGQGTKKILPAYTKLEGEV